MSAHDLALPPTIGEAIELVTAIEMELATLKAKRDAAIARKQTSGVSAAPDWFCNIGTRIRFTGVRHQQVQRHLAHLRTEQQHAHERRVERRFVDLAREQLPESTFNAIMADASAVAHG